MGFGLKQLVIIGTIVMYFLRKMRRCFYSLYFWDLENWSVFWQKKKNYGWVCIIGLGVCTCTVFFLLRILFIWSFIFSLCSWAAAQCKKTLSFCCCCCLFSAWWFETSAMFLNFCEQRRASYRVENERKFYN